MITYDDTSTLIKPIVDEGGSDKAELIWETADSLASAGLITVECRAALAAARRRDQISAGQLETAKAELANFIADLHLVEVTEALINNAGQLAEDVALRGYDAVHLAAALSVGATSLHAPVLGPDHQRVADPTDRVLPPRSYASGA